jgi:hypothetical protein
MLKEAGWNDCERPPWLLNCWCGRSWPLMVPSAVSLTRDSILSQLYTRDPHIKREYNHDGQTTKGAITIVEIT